MAFPTPIQIAWMAALFEGEGCVCTPISKNKKLGYSSPLRIKFSMTDRDVLARFMEYAGGGTLSGPNKPSGFGIKLVYHYSVGGPRAYALLVAFWPWLGARRKARITEAFILWGSMKPKRFGTKLTRDQVNVIKSRLSSEERGIGKELAKEYGVSVQMICHINRGRAWV